MAIQIGDKVVIMSNLLEEFKVIRIFGIYAELKPIDLAEYNYALGSTITVPVIQLQKR